MASGNCDRQFISTYDQRGYSQAVKEHCLTLYCNGMGFRGIERSTGVCHNTVINWVKEASSQIPDENYEIPETAQLDELFAELILEDKLLWGQKKQNFLKDTASHMALDSSKLSPSRCFKMGYRRSLTDNF